MPLARTGDLVIESDTLAGSHAEVALHRQAPHTIAPRCFGRLLLPFGGEAHGIDGLLDPERKQAGHFVGAALPRDERQSLAASLKSL